MVAIVEVLAGCQEHSSHWVKVSDSNADTD